MKKLLLAAVLGVQGLLTGPAPAPACPACAQLLRERQSRTVLTGVLGVTFHSIPQIPEDPPQFQVTWHLDSPGGRIELDFGLDTALEAQAGRLAGQRVVVSGRMLHRRLMQVVKLQEADVPQDVFGRLSEGPDGLILIADDGHRYRILTLCGNDDVLLSNARKWLHWRWGVQARGIVSGDVLLLTDVWPSEPRCPN
jgi:hypothetical protein